MTVHALPTTDAEHANDPLWTTICAEVRELIRTEPMLEDFLRATVLNHSSLESALSAHLGNQIDCATIPLASFATSSPRRFLHATIFAKPCVMICKQWLKETPHASHFICRFSTLRAFTRCSCTEFQTGFGYKADDHLRC